MNEAGDNYKSSVCQRGL